MDNIVLRELKLFFNNIRPIVQDEFNRRGHLNDVFQNSLINDAFCDLFKSILNNEYDKLLWVGTTISIEKHENSFLNGLHTIKKRFGYIICSDRERTAISEKWNNLINNDDEIKIHLEDRLSIFGLFNSGRLTLNDRLFLFTFTPSLSYAEEAGILINDEEILNHRLSFFNLLPDEIKRFKNYIDFLTNNTSLAFYCAAPLHHRTIFDKSFGETYVAASGETPIDKLNNLLFCLEKISLAFAIMIQKKDYEDLRKERQQIQQQKEKLKNRMKYFAKSVEEYSNKINALRPLLLMDDAVDDSKEKLVQDLIKLERLNQPSLIGSLQDQNQTLRKLFYDATGIELSCNILTDATESVSHAFTQNKICISSFEEYTQKVLHGLTIQMTKILIQQNAPNNYKTHIETLKPFFNVYSTRFAFSWWPLMGYHTENWWIEYLSQKIKVKIVTMGNNTLRDNPKFLPFFSYILNALFSSAINRTPPDTINCSVTNNGNSSNMLISWNSDHKPKNEDCIPIEQILLQKLESTPSRLFGRIMFLGWLFPGISGEGFKVEEDRKISFSLNVEHFRNIGGNT